MKILYILLLLVTLSTKLHAQHHISGYVFDASSNETLIGANLILSNTLSGTISNEFGYFNIPVNNIQTTLKCSFIGYTPFNQKVKIIGDTVINIYLEKGFELNEFTVKGTSSYLDRAETGIVQLSAKQMQMLPSLSGEVDVIKALQFMPGISSASEGSASLLVRGGNPDENLILLDDVPLYYSGHMGGFTSIFDESAIKSLKTYKAGFPARFGERLSSVVDIRTKDGNMKQRRTEIQIGTLVSKLSVNGPIIKDKLAYSASIRRSNIDWLIRPYTYYGIFDKQGCSSYNFYDFNAKLNYIFSGKDRAYFSFYRGNDLYRTKQDYNDSQKVEFRYKYKSDDGLLWNNTVGSFRWNHVFCPNLFSNFTIAAIKYQYRDYNEVSQLDYDSNLTAQKQESEFKSRVIDYLAKADFDWSLSSNQTLKFGSKLTFHRYNPSSVLSSLLVDTTILYANEYRLTGFPQSRHHLDRIKDLKATELAFYAEYLFKINQLDFNVGLRNVYFELNKQLFTSIQPRLNINYHLHKNTSIKCSYALMEQFTHMLSSDNGGGLPSDVWIPVGGKIAPANSHQVSLGYFYELPIKGVKLSFDAFYKTLDHLIDFKKGEDLFSTGNNWQANTEKDGIGRIGGFEVFAQKTSQHWNAWLGYTWTKNQRLFSNLNQGNPYPSKYERRHDFEIAVNYKFNKKVDVSATWNYASGIYQTLGQQRGVGINNYPFMGHNGSAYGVSRDASGYGFHDIYIYGKKNNFQYPAYQRMDVSVRFKKQKKHGVRTFTIGIINAYNHQNPYTVYYSYNTNGVLELKQKTLFPVLPSISWKYSFGEEL